MTQKIYNFIIFVLSLIGIFIALMLVLFDWSIIVLPCSSSGCSEVAHWKYSKFISAIGLIGYFLLAVFSFKRSQMASIKAVALSRWGIFVATIGAITSIFLIAFAKFKLNADCDWCMASAFTMSIIWIFSGFQVSNIKNIEPETKPVSVAHYFALLIIFLIISIAYPIKVYSDNVKVINISNEKIAILLPSDIKSHSLGPDNAPVTIVVFTDFICPSCKQSQTYIDELCTANPKTLRVVYRHYPLEMHPMAQLCSIASEAAELQGEGNFFRMKNMLYAAKEISSSKDIFNIAEILQLDMNQFKKDFTNTEPTSPTIMRLWKDMDDARKLEINATPTFFIITSDKIVLKANSPLGLSRMVNRAEIRKLLEKPVALPEPEPVHEHEH